MTHDGALPCPTEVCPHKGAAPSHLTLTDGPAPHPWLGHASGPLCQAKLLGNNGGGEGVTKLNQAPVTCHCAPTFISADLGSGKELYREV